MASYQLVNATSWVVPSTAADQVIRIYFRVEVPTSVGEIVLSKDEDISAAAYLIQEHFMTTNHSPVLERWPATLSIAPERASSVITSESLETMKRRLRRGNDI